MPRTHKNLNRTFVNLPIVRDEDLNLTSVQTNHIINVLRKRVGDELIVFNGIDGAWIGKIAKAGKKSATIIPCEQTSPQTKANDIWYGFAPLKSARLDYMVQKATEMGVAAIQPIITQYTQVRRIKHERLQANIIEAAEQCEILNVPSLLAEIKLENLINGWKEAHGERKLILADENMSASSPAEILGAFKGQPVGLLIGPEGGFSDEERKMLLAKEFVVPISLGPRILRADTAAIAGLTLIQSIIGDLR